MALTLNSSSYTLYYFDGSTFNPALDGARLSKQLERVYSVLQSEHWFTLAEIANITCDPESSISARLRDLRKSRFGSHKIQRQRRTQGLWEYRMTIRTGAQTLFDMSSV